MNQGLKNWLDAIWLPHAVSEVVRFRKKFKQTGSLADDVCCKIHLVRVCLLVLWYFVLAFFLYIKAV